MSMILTAKLLALALQAAPPPAPIPPPAPTPRAMPRDEVSLARSASTRDVRIWAAQIQQAYPAEALSSRIEGSVGVRVEVTPQGNAANCVVTSSSGSELLDQAACDGMERYARFNPALDAKGEPIGATYSTRITYRLSPLPTNG